jgi:antitoxin (DNA-binding transcriptional repressor) of toxin-antitoxin stability system
MKTLTATELARNLSRILDSLEHGSEEIVIVRNKHAVAKLIPGAPMMTALEAMSDLHRTLPYAEGEAWLRDSRKIADAVDDGMSDPWE